MNYEESQKSPTKFVIKALFFIAFLSLIIYTCIRMYNNNANDRFLNKVQEYAKVAKERLLSEDFMPNAGEGLIVPFSKIDVSPKYRIETEDSDLLDQYSYLIVVKAFGDFKDYKYFVAAKDEEEHCVRLTELNNISNTNKKRSDYLINVNECLIIKKDDIEPDSKLSGIELGFDVKYFRYE